MNEHAEEPVEGEVEEPREAPQGMTSTPPGGAHPGRQELMPVQAAPAPTLAVKPRVGADELVKRLDVIRAAMNDAMEEDVDYGVIPGTSGKPTLLKPGAEKLGVLFELDVQIVNEKLWEPPHLTVISKATVYHAPSGARLGYGEGICTTHEKKYATRKANRKCPECNAETIFRSKYSKRGAPDDDPPCWFCWGSKGGCGAEFDHDDKRITDQEVGEIENPNLPDAWNTVTKMAEKRARVDAVLAVTGASALFTQDVEDLPPEDRGTDAGEPAKTEGGESKSKGRGSKSSSSKGGGSQNPISANQKRRITNDLKAAVPEEFHEAIKAKVREGTSRQAGALIDKLGKLKAGKLELAQFLRGQGIEYSPPSDVPADTSDLDAAEREEAEAKAAAEAEGGGDAVEQTLLGGGSDDED